MKFATLLVAAISIAATGQEQEKDFFPIMAWSGVPNDPAAVKKMRDCGLTAVGPAGLSRSISAPPPD